jgi:hypothetical protein
MPRTRTVVLRLLFDETSWTLGSWRATSAKLTMPARSRFAPLIAETLIGTSWIFSERFVAVTISVSTSAALAATAAVSAACARPGAAPRARIEALSSRFRVLAMVVMVPPTERHGRSMASEGAGFAVSASPDLPPQRVLRTVLDH